MSTNVDLCYIILEESMKFVEMYLFLLTPCDFLQQWSQGVSISRHQNICAHLCRVLDGERPVSCLSTWCWITFTGWGSNFLCFRGSICEIISRVVRFLPLLLSFREKSGLSSTSTLFDTLLQEYNWVTPLSSLNVCGRFAMCCKYVILNFLFRFFEYVDIRTECE